MYRYVCTKFFQNDSIDPYIKRTLECFLVEAEKKSIKSKLMAKWKKGEKMKRHAQ